MIGVFRQKNPGNIFMLFLLGIMLKLPVFFESAAPIVKPRDSFVYTQIVGFFKPVAVFFPAIYAIMAFLLIYFQAYLLTIFINNNRLMTKVNFLPGMAYVLLTSLLPQFNSFSSPLIVSTLFISLFIILFSAHNQKITRGSIFNAGLILGLASLIFLPALLFIIWVYLALAMLRPFKLNEWLLLLTGVLTPYYFFVIILYLNDLLSWNYFFNGLAIGIWPAKFQVWHAVAIFLILMPLLAGAYYMQSTSGRMLIHVRKAWNLFLFYAAICLVMSFFNVGGSLENWVMILVPFAAIHGYGYFNAELKFYPKIAFWMTVLFIITSQIFSGM